MKNLSIIIMFIVIIIWGCFSNSSKGTKTTEKVIKEIINPGENQESVKDNKLIVTELTEDQIHKLELKSRINVTLLSVSQHLLTFASRSELTYGLLGDDLSDLSLMERYNNKLIKEIQEFDYNGINQKVLKYSLKDSFFKIYYYPETNKYYIACGKIKNPEIQISYGIQIGMRRDNFFSVLFNESDRYEFIGIDTIINGSEDGGIQQSFIFKQDSLSEIVIQSAMDWISCESD